MKVVHAHELVPGMVWVASIHQLIISVVIKGCLVEVTTGSCGGPRFTLSTWFFDKSREIGVLDE